MNQQQASSIFRAIVRLSCLRFSFCSLELSCFSRNVLATSERAGHILDGRDVSPRRARRTSGAGDPRAGQLRALLNETHRADPTCFSCWYQQPHHEVTLSLFPSSLPSLSPSRSFGLCVFLSKSALCPLLPRRLLSRSLSAFARSGLDSLSPFLLCHSSTAAA